MLMDLKVEVPQLEPSPLLLEQLSQLSRHSVATSPAGGPRSVRALMATATVTVIAGVSWLTGTMPGVASPFAREPGHGHAAHAPAAPGVATGAESAAPDLPEAATPTVPPGQTKPHQNNGNHTGQTKPHQNNGNHTGQTKPHQNNGNHTGQTKPHQSNGNQTGQTKPHENNGQGAGAADPGPSVADPSPTGADHGQSGGDHGQGNGHGT